MSLDVTKSAIQIFTKSCICKCQFLLEIKSTDTFELVLKILFSILMISHHFSILKFTLIFLPTASLK